MLDFAVKDFKATVIDNDQRSIGEYDQRIKGKIIEQINYNKEMETEKNGNFRAQIKQ